MPKLWFLQLNFSKRKEELSIDKIPSSPSSWSSLSSSFHCKVFLSSLSLHWEPVLDIFHWTFQNSAWSQGNEIVQCVNVFIYNSSAQIIRGKKKFTILLFFFLAIIIINIIFMSNFFLFSGSIFLPQRRLRLMLMKSASSVYNNKKRQHFFLFTG